MRDHAKHANEVSAIKSIKLISHKAYHTQSTKNT